MNNSMISKNVLVQRFIRKAIIRMMQRNIRRDDRTVVHSDLVPKFSSRVIQKHVESGPKIYHKFESMRRPASVSIPSSVSFSPVPVSPLGQPKVNNSVVVPSVPMIKNSSPSSVSVASTVPILKPPVSLPPASVSQVPKMPVMANSGPPVPSGKYGKLTLLTHDPSVLSIECSGSNSPVSVIRRGGQRQVTKISLSSSEIKSILQTFSDDSHVPLLDGVFRVIVNGWSVNAVISDLIGSKFVLNRSTN
jgi:hypothetical protein